MKLIYFIGIVAIMALSCSPARQAAKTSEVQLQQSKESTEYELIISDAKFDSWYQLNFTKTKDHSNEYYHTKNIIAAINWDEYFRTGKYTEVVDSYLNYQPHIDYGIELNRRLFWYFKYVQENFHVPLYY